MICRSMMRRRIPRRMARIFRGTAGSCGIGALPRSWQGRTALIATQSPANHTGTKKPPAFAGGIPGGLLLIVLFLLILIGRCGGRGQLLQIVLQEADFHTAAAQALGLGFAFRGGSG